jgi:hypothetical protein
MKLTIKDLPPPLQKKGWPWSEEAVFEAISIPISKRVLPAISLIIPVRLYSSAVEATLRSVLLQSYEPLQVLFVGSRAAIDALPESYRRWTSAIVASALTLGAILNAGLAKADGRFVHWLTPGDWLMPGALTHAAQAWDGETDAIAGRCLLVGEETAAVNPLAPTRRRQSAHVATDPETMLPAATFFVRAVFSRLNGFRDDLEILPGWEFLLRVQNTLPALRTTLISMVVAQSHLPVRASAPSAAALRAEMEKIYEVSGRQLPLLERLLLESWLKESHAA